MIAKNNIVLLLCTIVIGIGCMHEPVDDDYFDDLSLVRGGEKPTPPTDVAITYNQEERKIYITFYTDKEDNGNLLTYDPDTGTNENLYYLVYISATNPAQFSDPKLYYDIRYYVGYVAEKNFSPEVDPKTVVISISSSYHGLVYVWITSHDGGRESDHTNVVNETIP